MGKWKDESPEPENNADEKPHMGSAESKKYKQYKQRYRKEWNDNEIFKGWLREVRLNPCKAYCTICERELTAKYTDLVKHISTKRHVQCSPPLQFDIKVLPPVSLSTFTETSSTTKKVNYVKKSYNKKKICSSLAELGVQDYLKILRNLAQIPTLKNAVICNSAHEGVLIEACWTTRNFSSKERITSENHYVFKNYNVIQIPVSIRDQKIILKSYNGKGNSHAYIHQDEDKYYLGIVGSCGQITTLNLKDINKHGKIYSDPELSSLVFSHDSSHLAFIAEKKRGNTTSYLDKCPSEYAEEWGQKNKYFDNWGEQMEDYHESCVVVVNIETEVVTVLEFPDDLSGGHIIWSLDGLSIVGTAYVTEPFRLGLMYCRNRESVLFHMDLNGNFEEITSRGMHVQSPRFNPDGTSLVFLRCPFGGPHTSATQLCHLDWESKEVRVLVDFISKEIEIDEDQVFSGFTGMSIMPRRCWSKDGSKIFINNTDKFENAVYLIDADVGTVTRLPFDSSLTVHDCVDGWMLLSASSLAEPTRLFMWNDEWESNSFVQISEDITIDDISKDWINKFVCKKHLGVGNAEIPAIYFGPTEPSKDKRPLIVWPHGGPHTITANVFTYQALFFVRLGYSIIFPNYRGSIGQGRKPLQSLTGHIGTHDVNDCHGAAVEVLDKYKDVLDKTRVVLNGGSHGGFLVAQLSAQHPNFYKAVSTRNPVIDISTMVSMSDIPDWSYTEGGIPYHAGKNLSMTDIEVMRGASPIDIIEDVKAPTLFLLGKEDKRVPMSQGLHCHKLLKAKGVDTSVFIYDDNHPLGKVEVEVDSLVQTALWFDRHIR